MFRKKKLAQHYVYTYATNHDLEFRKYCTSRTNVPSLRVNGRWSPLEEGWLKLNMDAGCQVGVGIGTGGLLRGMMAHLIGVS